MKRNLGLVMVFAFLLLAACSLALSQVERGLTRDVTPTPGVPADFYIFDAPFNEGSGYFEAYYCSTAVPGGVATIAPSGSRSGSSLPIGRRWVELCNMSGYTARCRISASASAAYTDTAVVDTEFWAASGDHDAAFSPEDEYGTKGSDGGSVSSDLVIGAAVIPSTWMSGSVEYNMAGLYAVSSPPEGGSWTVDYSVSCAYDATPTATPTPTRTPTPSRTPDLTATAVAASTAAAGPNATATAIAATRAAEVVSCQEPAALPTGAPATITRTLTAPTAGPTPTALGTPPAAWLTPPVAGRQMAWFTEAYRRPVATPCVDYNGRGGCGNGDAFVEVSTVPDGSLGCYQVGIYDGAGALQCRYQYPADDLTGPLKVVWEDLSVNTGGGPCASWAVSGTLALWDAAGNLLDVLGVDDQGGGRSFASCAWTNPQGAWCGTVTPSPGR